MKLFSTERTDVHLLVSEYAKNLQLYLVNNRAHLAPFETLRDDDYFSLDNIQKQIINSLNDYRENRSLLLVVTLKDEEHIIGSINFTNFVFGVFQACYLGFSLDHASRETLRHIGPEPTEDVENRPPSVESEALHVRPVRKNL